MSRTYRLDPTRRYTLQPDDLDTYEPNGRDYFPQAAALGNAPAVREWNGVSLILSPVTDAELDELLEHLGL